MYIDFEEARGDGPDVFLLAPIDEETLRLALEDWAIWRRWEDAYHHGETTIDTHPALPEDLNRHVELEALLGRRLTIDPARATLAHADFRRRDEPNWNRVGMAPMEVRWTLVDQAGAG